MTGKELKEKILAEIERLLQGLYGKSNDYCGGKKYVLVQLRTFINSLPEEPVSEDLEKAAYQYACKCSPLRTEYGYTSPNPEVEESFKAGAKWQQNKVWHDGSEKPEIGETVIWYDKECPYPEVGYLTNKGFFSDTGWFDWDNCKMWHCRWAYFDDLCIDMED